MRVKPVVEHAAELVQERLRFVVLPQRAELGHPVGQRVERRHLAVLERRGLAEVGRREVGLVRVGVEERLARERLGGRLVVHLTGEVEPVGAVAEHLLTRPRTRDHAAEQRERGPVPESLAGVPAAPLPSVATSKLEDLVEERLVIRREWVLHLFRDAIGEVRLLHPVHNISATALHEVAGEAAAGTLVGVGHRHRLKLRAKHAEQRLERLLLPAVRCGREEKEVLSCLL